MAEPDYEDFSFPDLSFEDWFLYTFSRPSFDLPQWWTDKSGESIIYANLNYSFAIASAIGLAGTGDTWGMYFALNKLRGAVNFARFVKPSVPILAPLAVALVVGTYAGAGAEPQWTDRQQRAYDQTRAGVPDRPHHDDRDFSPVHPSWWDISQY